MGSNFFAGGLRKICWYWGLENYIGIEGLENLIFWYEGVQNKMFACGGGGENRPPCFLMEEL